jgi:hypothetical protein
MSGGGWRKIRTQAKFACGADGTPSHLAGICSDAETASQDERSMHAGILRRIVG